MDVKEQAMQVWSDIACGSADGYPISGLTAPANMYGFHSVPYIRPSRYYIGTSSGRSYRRCQRKWGFESSYRLGLHHIGTEENINFWFGSAIHWAMEDYFGFNKFGDPRRAFKAYYDCFDPLDRPEGAEEHYELGLGMLDYFMQWYPRHNKVTGFETAWFTYDVNRTPAWQLAEPFSEGAFPGTEIEICLDLGIRALVDAKTGIPVGELQYEGYWHSLKIQNTSGWAANYADDIVVPGNFGITIEDWNNYEKVFTLEGVGEFSGEHSVRIQPVCFHGTCDKIVKDMFGRLWITDYKTAKSADTNKLDTDDQISRYMWAAEQYLGMPVFGFCYLQLTKAVPKQPRVLKSGEISSDKSQKTTHYLYRKALEELYGDACNAPTKNVACLNALAEKESPEGDDFIRWDLVTRDKAQKRSTYHNLLAEAREWINTDKYLIPAPTRDCIWDCPYREACLSLEKGDFTAFEASLEYYAVKDHERDDEESTWKNRLQIPAVRPVGPPTDAELRINSEVELTVVLPDKEE